MGTMKFCDVGKHEVTVLFHARKSDRPSCCPNCYRPNQSIIQGERVVVRSYNEVRKPINKVSDKQAKINQAYSVLNKQFIKDNTDCQVRLEGCTGLAFEVHHLGTGSNKRKYFLDTRTWKSICRSCHDKIHSSMSAEELYELGLKIRT